MRIVSARIKSYRTIKDELDLDLTHGVTLVGPNNAGKTNILKSIRYFFTGYENTLGYNRDVDLSLNQGKTQTNIALTFSGDPAGSDREVYETLDAIRSLLDLSGPRPNDFTIYLTFSVNSNPSYRVFTNIKRPTAGSPKAQYSRLERKLVDSVLERFAVHYIPSDKSTSQLYEDLVLPFLFRRSFKAIQPHLGHIRTAMAATSASLDATLDAAGLGNLKCLFEFPETPERLFRAADFKICDPNSTSIFSKGMGIQSAALLAAFNWITEEEVGDGKSVLWLLEEPESYLHPELAQQCQRLITELRKRSQVVATTHSLGFVPLSPKHVIGVQLKDGWTEKKTFKTWHEATDRIRRSLGVRFSDYYALGSFNVLVEGETDRDYMSRILKIVCVDPEIKAQFQILTSDHVCYLDQGGVTALLGFAKATYEFISKERPCLILLDGDDAGDKCRRDLQGYLNNKKIPFEANRHFVIVKDRFPIEGLFPAEWIKHLHTSHAGWFKDFSEDAEGNLQPFAIKDEHKRQYMEWMLAKAAEQTDVNWASAWFTVFRAVEKGLGHQGNKIYGESPSHILANLQVEEATDLPEPTSLKAVEQGQLAEFSGT